MKKQKTMKKLLIVLAATITLALVGPALAGDSPMNPGGYAAGTTMALSGQDVLIHGDVLAETGLDVSRPMFVAWDANGWFVRGSEIADQDRRRLEPVGNGWWKAPGMAGFRFTVVNLDGTGQPEWAQLHRLIPNPALRWTPGENDIAVFVTAGAGSS
jgi:hypothetical protein